MDKIKTLFLAAAAIGGAQAATPALNDAQLLNAATEFLKSHNNNDPSRTLGVHHGTEVVAVIVPGSGLSFTTRFVHYAVEPGVKCDQIGGHVASVIVRHIGDIADTPGEVCVPDVLFRNGRYEGGGPAN